MGCRWRSDWWQCRFLELLRWRRQVSWQPRHESTFKDGEAPIFYISLILEGDVVVAQRGPMGSGLLTAVWCVPNQRVIGGRLLTVGCCFFCDSWYDGYFVCCGRVDWWMSPYVFLYPPTLFPPPFNGSNLDILLLLKKEKKIFFKYLFIW